jgi:hypothetical protein
VEGHLPTTFTLAFQYTRSPGSLEFLSIQRPVDDISTRELHRMVCFGCVSGHDFTGCGKTRFLSNSPQNRHPEGSASQNLSRNTALAGAQSKDPGGAYLTHAALSFSTTEIGEHGRIRDGSCE